LQKKATIRGVQLPLVGLDGSVIDQPLFKRQHAFDLAKDLVVLEEVLTIEPEGQDPTHVPQPLQSASLITAFSVVSS